MAEKCGQREMRCILRHCEACGVEAISAEAEGDCFLAAARRNDGGPETCHGEACGVEAISAEAEGDCFPAEYPVPAHCAGRFLAVACLAAARAGVADAASLCCALYDGPRSDRIDAIGRTSEEEEPSRFEEQTAIVTC